MSEEPDNTQTQSSGSSDDQGWKDIRSEGEPSGTAAETQVGTETAGTSDAGAQATDPAGDTMSQEVAALTAAPAPTASVGAQKASRFSIKHIDRRGVVLIVVLSLVLLAVIAGGLVKFVFHEDGGGNQQTQQAAQPAAKKLGIAPSLLEGTVEFSTDKGASWQKLADKTNLAEGNQVRTLTDGRAVLLLDDGSAMRLAANSGVELTSLDAASVVVTQLSGELYSRVVASTARKYAVNDEGRMYVAKGTAFRTSNTATKKGVEVFHSTVNVEDKTVDVAEGNAYFSLSEQKEKQDVVSAIDLSALKKDEFIKWNSEQDKKEAEFADKLGVLTELDKPDPTPPAVTTTPAPSTQKPATSTNGITLKGSVSEYSAVFSWKVVGVDTSKGFKLVKSSSNKNPTYPENSAAYIESGKTSYNLYLGDGKTYYFRLCAYRDGSCDSYSNTVTLTTPAKPKASLEHGSMTLSLSGTTASWSYTGTAPYGFKLVVNTTGAPTYPESTWKYITSGTSSPLPDGLTSGTKYYVRVCKYVDGSCTDYSNELTYTAP